MGLNVLQLTGWIDGEHPIATAGTDHVAGQPAKLTATGWQLALAPGDVGGLFKNDMAVDVLGGPAAGDAPATGTNVSPNGSVVIGLNKVQMVAGLLKTGASQIPWLQAASHAWAVGVHLYVTAAGFWDNAPASANDPPFGYVTKAPASATDTLEAVMFSMAPFYSAVIV